MRLTFYCDICGVEVEERVDHRYGTFGRLVQLRTRKKTDPIDSIVKCPLCGRGWHIEGKITHVVSDN